MRERKNAVGLISSEHFQKPVLLNNLQLYQVNTLSQLQKEVAKLDKHCQDLAEQKQNQEQEVLNSQVEQGVQKLVALAWQINALATELEAEILKFKEIAVAVNRGYHAIQQPPNFRAMGWDESRLHYWRPSNIWEVHYSAIPTVVRRGAKFVLTAKIIDMFKAEREIDAQKRVKAAQKSREALEQWLTGQHQHAVPVIVAA